jgi:elongator complex protein 3 (tRNA carboxymethyluridine synthase)
MTDKEFEKWQKRREYDPEKMEMAHRLLAMIREGAEVMPTVRAHPLPKGGYVAKHQLVTAYRERVASGEWPEDQGLLARIRMKPGRTLSGVTTVTVLTAPCDCPGECVFCPNDSRMPKSYLPDEPGAARAFQNAFDPYKQVRSRIDAYEAVGHPTDKIELLILGGTWHAYSREYREWFVGRCFDAMNEEVIEDLSEAQHFNETARHRNVGLVIETRPDEINPAELAEMRRLGVTKVQMGAQSLDDDILLLNKRGHSVDDLLRATAFLRAGGFKIVLHWMPNLLGATLESDREDFGRLWASSDDGLGFCPDELKIYPTQLLEGTELYERWQQGKYQPYTTEELIDLIADVKPGIPTYCRVNRVIRDIPSHHVVEGNKHTNLRQDVFKELKRRGHVCRCVRCREIRREKVEAEQLVLVDEVYRAAFAEEHFLSYVTPGDRLAGYLRLSLPSADAPDTDMADLDGAALIREVHVYGQSIEVGEARKGAAQHIGLGTQLLERAEEIAIKAGFKRLAVIAAVGTRVYYESRGFQRSRHYMIRSL